MTFGYYSQPQNTASSRAAPPNPQRGAGAQQLGQVLQALRTTQAASQAAGGTGSGGGAASTPTGGVPIPPATVDPAGGGSFRGGVARAATGAAGLLGGFGVLAGAAIVAARRLGKMADNTLAVNQVLEDYNAQIAGANARAVARGQLRAIALGAVVGPSYSRLSEARSDFADMRGRIGAPLAAAGQNAMAGIQETLNNILREWEPLLMSLAEKVNEIAIFFFGKGTAQQTELIAEQMLRDFADGSWDGKGMSSFLKPPGTPLDFRPGQRAKLFGAQSNPLRMNWP